jgi:hypothetical protein
MPLSGPGPKPRCLAIGGRQIYPSTYHGRNACHQAQLLLAIANRQTECPGTCHWARQARGVLAQIPPGSLCAFFAMYLSGQGVLYASMGTVTSDSNTRLRHWISGLLEGPTKISPGRTTRPSGSVSDPHGHADEPPRTMPSMLLHAAVSPPAVVLLVILHSHTHCTRSLLASLLDPCLALSCPSCLVLFCPGPLSTLRCPRPADVVVILAR